MRYVRVRFDGEAIVVAFDMCSSSDIIEGLTLRGDLSRFQGFLGSLKHYLASAQESITFDPYKFTGDGWILLFPVETAGGALLPFLRELCAFFEREFQAEVLAHLEPGLQWLDDRYIPIVEIHRDSGQDIYVSINSSALEGMVEEGVLEVRVRLLPLMGVLWGGLWVSMSGMALLLLVDSRWFR